ncbi:RDD family protein [Mucilaginibacter robiniae]|uniref:RDD family protein n=1 Tax=Mucilaginibacter robiniae TaxID=2728022 RepID=A0A7L5E139_9SPHI|nr:RDD family protein [Mucilaginibacter robiniae]QJD96751.1 RDD family protein [Mucilaginibacter robiniae]
MQTITINTSQNIAIDYEMAGIGERILARLIDYGIFIAILILGVIITLSTSRVVSNAAIGFVFLVYFGLYIFYDLVCEIFMNGQSVGKRLMKIKVVSLDGAQPTIGQYLLRWLFRVVDFGIGGGMVALIAAAVSDKHQRIGDLVAGTTLIKTSPRTTMEHVAHLPVTDLNYEPVFTQAVQLIDKEVALIHEVIGTYMQTGNQDVVYQMAARIKEHLGITLTQMQQMDDLQFLQTIVKDYNHMVAANDATLNA